LISDPEIFSFRAAHLVLSKLSAEFSSADLSHFACLETKVVGPTFSPLERGMVNIVTLGGDSFIILDKASHEKFYKFML